MSATFVGPLRMRNRRRSRVPTGFSKNSKAIGDALGGRAGNTFVRPIFGPSVPAPSLDGSIFGRTCAHDPNDDALPDVARPGNGDRRPEPTEPRVRHGHGGSREPRTANEGAARPRSRRAVGRPPAPDPPAPLRGRRPGHGSCIRAYSPSS